ncbi:hypothetical protein SPF06_20915 [Sinomonas sp. JGH33]|uniref:Uncharacterized protein n=1 Tax=Sinomonas terricola TaxID=3110330 RepID=A0ABU5TCE1_9MICC|nr:hypothetical protein [Sinomonas sp. JGH33]MEA5457190.1 hypothetical protein [Sinomonas sp. JGH33]
MRTEPNGSEAEVFGVAAGTVDVSAIPDGSGNDRDGDETDDERFDAG